MSRHYVTLLVLELQGKDAFAGAVVEEEALALGQVGLDRYLPEIGVSWVCLGCVLGVSLQFAAAYVVKLVLCGMLNFSRLMALSALNPLYLRLRSSRRLR